MSDEMKMRDVFGEKVGLVKDGAGLFINQLHYYNPKKKCDATDELHCSHEAADSIYHAINNHDRLTEENKRLRELLHKINDGGREYVENGEMYEDIENLLSEIRG